MTFVTIVTGGSRGIGAATRRLLARHGHRVAVGFRAASAAATLGSPGEYVHYAATKAAVDALTIGLSKELGPAGIRVNTVSPGIIDTDFHATNSGEPGRAHRLGPRSPLGRAGTPEAIAWLLSPQASYVNGANLRVSGGL